MIESDLIHWKIKNNIRFKKKNNIRMEVDKYFVFIEIN